MFDLKNAKWISSPSEPPVFENNEERSYLKAFGKPDMVVIENYGGSPIFRFMRLFPGNAYIKRHINSRAYLRRYRVMNHLSAAPNAYQMKNPLIYVVVRNGCKYRFEKIDGVDEPDFLDLMVQVIESSDKYCDEMTAVVMDCCKEDAAKDFVPQIRWGMIVTPEEKTVQLLDKDGAAVQFHRRFKLIKNSYLS